MAKNISTQQKTIQAVADTTESDNWNADRFLIYGNYLDTVILPTSNILDDYYDYFETLLVDVDVPERFFYQPAAFAENFYGTPDLDFLVLYFAQIPTFLDFDKKTIKALPTSRLTDLNQLAIKYKDIVTNSYKNPQIYEEMEDVSIDLEKKYY